MFLTYAAIAMPSVYRLRSCVVDEKLVSCDQFLKKLRALTAIYGKTKLDRNLLNVSDFVEH